jgi:predicted transcriptional regulator
MMASYIEAQLAERLACVAKPMRYSSSTMMCDSINERIVAMAITREAWSHGDKRAENLQTRAHDASHRAT